MQISLKPVRSKRSFDRLDASPFGFAASARAFLDADSVNEGPAVIKTRSLETLPVIPKRRLRYQLNDGYLFG